LPNDKFSRELIQAEEKLLHSKIHDVVVIQNNEKLQQQWTNLLTSHVYGNSDETV
jgi:hypothetical protein